MSSVETVAADILVEFLEVALHTILYSRKIYPDSIFVKRRKYGIPINVSIHPQLNEYINECLKAIQLLAKENELRKVVVCFFNQQHVLLQRYIFDILKLSSMINSDPYFIQGEQALRAFCLRIAASDGYTKPLPDGSTFTIQVHTTEAASINLGMTPAFENFPWLEIDASMAEMDTPNIVPIQTINTDYILMQMYIEQVSPN